MTQYLKYTFRTLDKVAPSLAAKGIYHFMSNPRTGKLREFEIEELRKAKTENYLFGQFNIKKYRWGKSDKKVLCVHGWEGQGKRLAWVVTALKTHDEHKCKTYLSNSSIAQIPLSANTNAPPSNANSPVAVSLVIAAVNPTPLLPLPVV